jgi:hypothetical protein
LPQPLTRPGESLARFLDGMDLIWFEVAMDEPAIVGGGETLGRL